MRQMMWLVLLAQHVIHVAALDTLSSGLASMARMPVALGQSTTVGEYSSSLSNVVLYDGGESDPTSREIRECCTYLDLSVLVYPSGRGSRTEGKAQSIVVDGEKSYSGKEAVEFLLADAGAPTTTTTNGDAGHFLASTLRSGRGMSVDLSRAPLAPPRKPLELYNYEGNQFCRLVREVLFELDLPYTSIACGKGSPKRAELAEISGSTTCPFLVDPNAKVSMGESADIVKYLEATYAVQRTRDDYYRRGLKAELASFAVDSCSGILDLSEDCRSRFDRVLSELVRSNPTPKPASSSKLDGEWVLLWTTEKELLFLMKNGLLGKPCTTVTQTVDANANSLVNFVGCGESSFLKVESYLGGGGDSRDDLDFEFSACSLKYGSFPPVPLPPVGKGNFKIAYLDDDFRVQFDSRGDTLMSTRATAVKEAPFLPR